LEPRHRPPWRLGPARPARPAPDPAGDLSAAPVAARPRPPPGPGRLPERVGGPCRRVGGPAWAGAADLRAPNTTPTSDRPVATTDEVVLGALSSGPQPPRGAEYAIMRQGSGADDPICGA